MIESRQLPMGAALIQFADSEGQFPDESHRQGFFPKELLRIVCDDATDSYGLVKAPDASVSERILSFYRRHSYLPHLIAQCEKGIGRSLATAAALYRIRGESDFVINQLLHKGTHNPKLYRLLCEVGGKPATPEPLVSVVVRVKYSPDRLLAFLLSMERQRYENWQIIVVTDGPDEYGLLRQTFEEHDNSMGIFIETPLAKGHWGHPYRQVGIDAALNFEARGSGIKSEFIVLTNDDNYYTPGFIEQMVNALGPVPLPNGAAPSADIACCQTSHSYFGWGLAAVKPDAPGDLGAWMIRRSLAQQVPFTGEDWMADGRWINALRQRARKEVMVPRVLFCHN